MKTLIEIMGKVFNREGKHNQALIWITNDKSIQESKDDELEIREIYHFDTPEHLVLILRLLLSGDPPHLEIDRFFITIDGKQKELNRKELIDYNEEVFREYFRRLNEYKTKYNI